MREKFLHALSQLVPAPAINYCIELWDQTPFSFTLSKSRNSCFGNHMYHSDKGHKITVNHDLSPHAFLLTYIHEVAHLRTVEEQITQKSGLFNRKKRFDPHGLEWKRNFKVLMEPLLSSSFFPPDVLPALKDYMKNPRASSVSHQALAKALHLKAEGPVLENMQPGQSFIIRGQRFKIIEFRRTRALCEEHHTKKRYLVAKIAAVEPIV
jgi:SprT protein